MTTIELQELRSRKWRIDGNPIRTLDEAREFIESAGFCLMYPVRPPLFAPTFIGAWMGTGDKLPDPQHAFFDPDSKAATEVMVRLLRERAAYEANLFAENSLLIAASIFPYFYALVGDRNPRQAPRSGPRSEYSPLALVVFEALNREGPLSKPRLAEKLGGAPSAAALDRALNDLWAKLRITRVDYNPAEGASWDVLHRWAPEAVREGVQLSVAEALSALSSKYLDCVVAAEQAEVEEFFSHFVPRTRVREAIHALLAARELSFVHVGNRSLLQVTPPRAPVVPRSRPRAVKS